MSSVIFAAKLRHKQNHICRQLFVGHVMAFAPMRKKEKFHRMIIYIFRFSQNLCYLKDREVSTVTCESIGRWSDWLI